MVLEAWNEEDAANKEKLRQKLQTAETEIAHYLKEAQKIKPSLSSQNKEKRGIISKTESLKKLFATYANKVSAEVNAALNPSDRPLPPIPSRSGGGSEEPSGTEPKRGRAYTHAGPAPNPPAGSLRGAALDGVMFARSNEVGGGGGGSKESDDTSSGDETKGSTKVTTPTARTRRGSSSSSDSDTSDYGDDRRMDPKLQNIVRIVSDAADGSDDDNGPAYTTPQEEAAEMARMAAQLG